MTNLGIEKWIEKLKEEVRRQGSQKEDTLQALVSNDKCYMQPMYRKKQHEIYEQYENILNLPKTIQKYGKSLKDDNNVLLISYWYFMLYMIQGIASSFTYKIMHESI